MFENLFVLIMKLFTDMSEFCPRIYLVKKKKTSLLGPGWLVEPSVREMRVRRKMLRNCRESSGFPFFLKIIFLKFLFYSFENTFKDPCFH